MPSLDAERRRAAPWLAAALALGLGAGLTGLSAGLPGARRLRVLPGGRPTPELARRLADAWTSLYDQIRRAHARMASEEPVTYATGRLVVPAGWSFPPQELLNSTRSFMLQTLEPDEKKSFIVLSQMRPWKLDFQPLYAQYGGAFIYPLGAALAGASVARAAVLTRDVAHYIERPEDMGRLYLVGRLFVLLFELGCLALLFALGRSLGGPAAGFLAAAFLALSPMAVENSHLVKPHACAAFWALASAWQLLQAYRSGRTRHYLWCGAFAGLAAGTALTLAFAGAWPLLAFALRRFEGKTARAEAAAAVGAGGLCVLVCAAFNPYLLVSARSFAWEVEVYGGGAPAPFLQGLRDFAASAAQGLGPVLALLLAGATLAGLRARGERRLLACAALLGTLVLWLKFRSNAFRLYYPLVGLGCALAADALLRLPRAVAAALLLAALADTGLRSGVMLADLSRSQSDSATRLLAADWLESHLPPGAALGLVRLPDPAHCPPFRLDRFRLEVLPRASDWTAPDAPEYAVVDADGLSLLDSWGIADYNTAARFLPAQAGWARRDDDPTFANTGFFVLRRRGLKTASAAP